MAQKAQKGRGSGPNAGNCDHSSPADAVSIGPSALDRSTSTVRSAVRSHDFIGSQRAIPRRHHCRPARRFFVSEQAYCECRWGGCWPVWGGSSRAACAGCHMPCRSADRAPPDRGLAQLPPRTGGITVLFAPSEPGGLLRAPNAPQPPGDLARATSTAAIVRMGRSLGWLDLDPGAATPSAHRSVAFPKRRCFRRDPVPTARRAALGDTSKHSGC